MERPQTGTTEKAGRQLRALGTSTEAVARALGGTLRSRCRVRQTVFGISVTVENGQIVAAEKAMTRQERMKRAETEYDKNL